MLHFRKNIYTVESTFDTCFPKMGQSCCKLSQRKEPEILQLVRECTSAEELEGHLDNNKSTINARNRIMGSTPLIIATKRRNEEFVNIIIKKGARLNAVDTFGMTALHCAAYDGCERIVEMLIKSGAGVNKCDQSKETPLMLECKEGKKDCAALLIEAGADLDKRNEDRWTALIYAARFGHFECAELLLRAGANVNKRAIETPLMEAAEYGNHTCLDVLIQHGADVNFRSEYDGRNTALKLASENGHHKCVELLIEAGANVNLPGMYDESSKYRETCLVAAVSGLHVKCVKLLLTAGANVNVRNKQGANAIETMLQDYRHIRYGEHIFLLYAAGERNGEVNRYFAEQNEHLDIDLTLNLKHMCRIAITDRLISANPANLFVQVPLLGLPSSLTHYLLYNLDLNLSSDDDLN